MKQKQIAIFFVIMPLVCIVFGSLWLLAGFSVAHAPSVGGIRDLRAENFDETSFDLSGEVEYIPSALLNPDEFKARRDKIEIGFPSLVSSYSTSRLCIYTPSGTYGLMLYSSEYASNVYINGQLAEKIGVPGNTAAYSIPGVKRLFYTVAAPDGVIEIVQQSSNYVFQAGDNHNDIIIGKPDTIRNIYNKRIMVASIVMGCFLTLFLVHIVLFFLLRFYKANLWFALFCFLWLLRTGYTDPWIMSSLIPLSWDTAFRLSILTYPSGTLLLCLTFYDLFPVITPKWFRFSLTAVSSAYVPICLFSSTQFIEKTLPLFYLIIMILAVFILTSFAIKLRRPSTDQAIVLTGMIIFIFGALRDIFYFDAIPMLLKTNLYMSELTQLTLAEFALLIFVFFQMIAIFHRTMHEVTTVKATEQKLAMENAALDRVNRLKNKMLATLTHEMRTPLAVMSTYAQLTIKDIQEENIGKQTVDDLLVLREEAERLADMVTDYLDVFREDEKVRGHRSVDFGLLIHQTGRLIAPMLSKKGNHLSTIVPNNLPKIAGNVSELTQVMFNIFINANNHTQDGEIEIRVALLNNGHMVKVSISDTGTGIETELLPHIFKRHATDGTGAGLGLSICQEIIMAHGGKINAESEPGKGTTIKFTLPVLGGEDNDGQRKSDIGSRG